MQASILGAYPSRERERKGHLYFVLDLKISLLKINTCCFLLLLFRSIGVISFFAIACF